MPRQARINIPNELYHVIARGIERRKIYRNNKDKKLFLRRLSKLIVECEVVCYAWALLDNHFHLLIKPTETSLPVFMQRLLCGYAVNFNVCHKRSGHLFQNRYKSILCQKENYFLELVRYIHLNPLRGGMVADVNEMTKYPWSGHATLMGTIKRPWQETSEIYERFSDKKTTAIKKYLEYIEAAKDRGVEKRFQGGGLVRSVGGWAMVKEMMKSESFCQSDERILGDGEYVKTVLERANQKREKQAMKVKTLQALFEFVGLNKNIAPEELLERKRGNRAAEARAVAVYLAKVKMNKPTSEIADYLKISDSATSRLIKKGKKYYRDWEWLI